MGRRRLKNFSDLSFIQQLDQPRFLVPLLAPYAGDLRRLGVDIAELRNSDEANRRLLAVFRATEQVLPASLMKTLCMLDDLADEAGHGLIVAELEREEIPLHGVLGWELSPGDFAIAVHLRRPKLLLRAHRHATSRSAQVYEEYQARTEKLITLPEATAKQPDLERLLASCFAARNRGPACTIAVHEDQNDLRFDVTHGQPIRMISTIDARLARSRVSYRQQQEDAVIFERRSRSLKVSAQTEGEREMYRRALGTAFFEDEDHFPVSEVYSFEPLRQAGLQLATVAGIESARLTELQKYVDDELRHVQVLRGHDLLIPGGPSERARVAPGKIMGASFEFAYENGDPPRTVDISLPNVARYDRTRDGQATEQFLLANGLLVRGAR